ncbi:hypothetical protein D3C71_2156110 [compost metagenome]
MQFIYRKGNGRMAAEVERADQACEIDHAQGIGGLLKGRRQFRQCRQRQQRCFCQQCVDLCGEFTAHLFS